MGIHISDMAYVPPHKRSEIKTPVPGGSGAEGPAAHVFTMMVRPPGIASFTPRQDRLQLRPPTTAQWTLSTELLQKWKIPKSIPDDVVLWVSVNMLMTSMPVIEVLESGLKATPCICCYGTTSESRATDVDISLRMILSYFSPESRTNSISFYRDLSSLMRDITPREEKNIKRRLKVMKMTHEYVSDVCRGINFISGLCVMSPACREKTLWVCSTPGGRKFMRRCIRALKAEKVTARVSLITEDVRAVPRFINRIYALKVVEEEKKFSDASFWEVISRVGKAMTQKKNPSQGAARAALSSQQSPKAVTIPTGGDRTGPQPGTHLRSTNETPTGVR